MKEKHQHQQQQQQEEEEEEEREESEEEKREEAISKLFKGVVTSLDGSFIIAHTRNSAKFLSRKRQRRGKFQCAKFTSEKDPGGWGCGWCWGEMTHHPSIVPFFFLSRCTTASTKIERGRVEAEVEVFC